MFSNLYKSLLLLQPRDILFGVVVSLDHESHLLKDVHVAGEIKCRLQFEIEL